MIGGRLFVSLALCIWAVGAGLAGAALRPVAAPSAVRSIGRSDAPVVVMEYASLGCPHCAVWAKTEFPALKAKYIDTGRVRFEFHEMLNGNSSLAAAGWLTARCAPAEKYLQVVEAVFAAQDEISGGGGIDTLAHIAKAAGVARPQLDACLADEAALKALTARADQAIKVDKVTATPAFAVAAAPANSVTAAKLIGYQTLAQLDKAIAEVTPKPARQAPRRVRHAH